MEKEFNIEELEDVQFTFSKDTFAAKEMHCKQCKKKLEKTTIELPLSNSLSVKIEVHRCQTCKKEYLNFQEAKKLDKALLLSRLLEAESFKIKKSLSFDGDSYIFRIPAEIARNLGKKPYAEVTPLSSQDLLLHLHKS